MAQFFYNAFKLTVFTALTVISILTIAAALQ